MRARMTFVKPNTGMSMAELEPAWIEGVVVANKHLTQNLFSLQIEADLAPFEAGQYTSIGINVNGERVAQPYSILSAPQERPLEFFFYTQLDGQLSARLAHLQAGDSVWVQQLAEGGFTLKQVPAGRDLWLLATGTGVAPFLSIIKSAEVWEKFAQVILVYAVRQWDDIAYSELIEDTKAQYGDRFTFVPFVSREKVEGSIHGHIPACLSNGTIERVAGRELSLQHSQFMLCGNPGMVQDALQALEQRGFVRSVDGQSGQITLEAYW
jgi:ferredoxin--NADP+ reductase